jgi:hypothetical protein
LEEYDDEKISGKIRVVNTKHRTWRDRPKLKELDRIVKRSQDRTLNRLEKRIFALKKQLELNKEVFEVDCAYDWPSYLVEENLTKFKEEWNNRRLPRKSTHRTSVLKA